MELFFKLPRDFLKEIEEKYAWFVRKCIKYV